MRDRRANTGHNHSIGRRSTAVTPIAFVQTILRAYEKYAADPSEALRLARIARSDLQRSEARVTATQLETDVRPLPDRDA